MHSAKNPLGGPDAALKGTLNDLDGLLSRLERQVLSDYADPELRRSVFARRKTGASIEHARTLLLGLEHDLSFIKIQNQRTALTAVLRSKRDLIKQLNRQLTELEQLDNDDASDAETSRIPLNRDAQTAFFQDTPSSSAAPPLAPASHSAPSAPTVRARGSAPSTASQAADTGTTTSALFAGRRQAPPPDPTTPSDRAALLQAQESEQENIKLSLLGLASALRASNVSFSQSLEEEKSVLDRAVGGLDSNALGMEGAGRKMGALRKMTEGQGWYGRVKLYALVAALWLAAFLLVFVAPKLRF